MIIWKNKFLDKLKKKFLNKSWKVEILNKSWSSEAPWLQLMPWDNNDSQYILKGITRRNPGALGPIFAPLVL